MCKTVLTFKRYSIREALLVDIDRLLNTVNKIDMVKQRFDNSKKNEIKKGLINIKKIIWKYKIERLNE